VALGVLAAGVAGFVALNVLKPRPAVRAPAKQLPLVRVEPVAFHSGALAVIGNGLVKPRVEVVLAAEVSGRVVFVSPNLVTGGAFGPEGGFAATATLAIALIWFGRRAAAVGKGEPR